jgi:hypothetical protein
MKYIRNSVKLISSDDLSMYQNCIDWYFYILDYGHTNKYNDYIIFLDLNEYYMNEIKKRMEEVKEITITTNPDEFKIIDQIFLEMQDTLNHLKDQDRIRFDIGEMMKWIQEANPNFNTTMYEKLMNSIETYRTKFTMVQSKLISIHNEMKNLLTLFPSRFFLVTIGNNELPELKIVTSTRTNNVFQSGNDDEVNLFKSDTTK